MEISWGREAMKFARKEIPALLNEYEGKPDGFFKELDKRWRAQLKLQKDRMAALPKDEPGTEEAQATDDGDSAGK